MPLARDEMKAPATAADSPDAVKMKHSSIEAKPSPHQHGHSPFGRFLREPLLHFLIIGAFLFVICSVRERSAARSGSFRSIKLTREDLRQLAASFEAEKQRAPTQPEFANLIENQIREEILYHESLTNGFDGGGDAAKRGVVPTATPSNAELRAWFETNAQLFAQSERATFRHLYFARERGSERARNDATKALVQLSGKPVDSSEGPALADPFMFQDYYADATPERLSVDFGPQFANELFRLKPGSWQGAIESSHGWHLVWIDSITPARRPNFDDMQSEINAAWDAAQKEKALNRSYQALRARYQIVLPSSIAIEAIEKPAGTNSASQQAAK